MKSSTDLPEFVVYQPNPKEFHICLEVGSVYYCWWSNYPPTRDIRADAGLVALPYARPDLLPYFYLS